LNSSQSSGLVARIEALRSVSMHLDARFDDLDGLPAHRGDLAEGDGRDPAGAARARRWSGGSWSMTFVSFISLPFK
jgi:hypothetical protein